MERGLLWITRQPFHLYGSEAISETEDKRTNILTEDAPVALVLEPWVRSHGQGPNTFLTNHNIALAQGYTALNVHSIRGTRMFMELYSRQPKTKTTQVSIKRMAEWTVVYSHNGVLYNHEKQWVAATNNNVDKSHRCNVEPKKPETKGMYCVILFI